MIQASSMTARSRFAALSTFLSLFHQLMPGQSTPEVRQCIEKVTSCLQPAVVVTGDPHPCPTLAERMDQLHVPGVSVAVIHNGAIEWTRGLV
jgi:hypothetical protein